MLSCRKAVIDAECMEVAPPCFRKTWRRRKVSDVTANVVLHQSAGTCCEAQPQGCLLPHRASKRQTIHDLGSCHTMRRSMVPKRELHCVVMCGN